MRHAAAPAVVLGLDCITGLQTARILAAHGVPVIGVARDPGHFCCRTRVCTRVVAADTKTEALIAALEALGPALGQPAVLVPCTDLSVLLVSRHRQRLQAWYRIGLPPEPVVETLLDKLAFSRHAAEAGLPIPETRLLHSRDDVERAAEHLRFPCILKPPVKTPAWERRTKEKVFKLETRDELLACYDRCAPWAPALIVQEWIDGGDDSLFSCNCYFDRESRPLVTFVARKLRQWPPGTGTSSLGEEARNHEVLQASVALFRGLGFQGLGYVEMKRDRRTGRHYIIEPNIGRPTGRSAIAELGGVDLLYTMYCDLAGEPLPPNRTQRYRGTKWIYLRHDLQSAWHDWRAGTLSAAGWLRSLRGVRRDAVLSLSDPMPGLADFRNSAFAALGRRRRVALNEHPWLDTTVRPTSG